MSEISFTFHDFFAGGGMVGFGLGPRWRCAFANEIDPRKAASCRDNHGGWPELLLRDVAVVTLDELPRVAPDLTWASFPCQDLSLAGNGAGLAGKRSGTFTPFWKLMRRAHDAGLGPKIIALENVCCAITSKVGCDFETIASAFAGLGYRFGAIVVDAVRFLPHSRPRLFVIGVRGDLQAPAALIAHAPDPHWHSRALIAARERLRPMAAERWLWWTLPIPAARELRLSSIVGDEVTGVSWHSAAQNRDLLGMMSDHNRAKVEAAKSAGGRVVGTVFRRTRTSPDGVKRQRAEVRFDEVAGCLRTPVGCSSRQTVVVIDGDEVRSRLLSPREAASLMGLPERYVLPPRYNDAYKVAGDGVAVPVVRHLGVNIFEPILHQIRLGPIARSPQ